jgi:hypothetical protein
VLKPFAILQHHNWPKFILFGKNPRYPGFVHEEKCFKFLDDLAQLWDGRVSTLELRPPEECRSNGASRWFRYVRVSDHERMLEFRPDQRIGYGSSDRERIVMFTGCACLIREAFLFVLNAFRRSLPV